MGAKVPDWLEPLWVWQTAAAVGLVGFAGIVRGFSGFGSAMILAPSLSALYPPTIAIPLLITMEIALSLQMLPQAAKKVVWNEILILSVAALTTVGLGVWMLEVLEPQDLRIAISALVLTFLLLVILGVKRKGPKTTPGLALMGALSGVGNGASGIGGPPIVLYYLAGSGTGAELRATAVCYFFIIDLFSMAIYVARGLMSVEIGLIGIICLPASVFGVWLGSHLFKGASDKVYRIVAYGIIAAVAILSLFA